jgi:hypothetical protein
MVVTRLALSLRVVGVTDATTPFVAASAAP